MTRIPTVISASSSSSVRRRVVLCELYWTRDKDPRVPLGHASLLASLRSTQGVDVASVVLPVNLEPLATEEVARRLVEPTRCLAPEDVDVAVGAYVWAEPLLRELPHALRAQGFRGRIIYGGPQISYSGAGLERHYPGVDAFVRGYGEAALRALAVTSGRPRIHGVHYAGEPDLVNQAKVDLHELPSPWLDGIIPLADQRFLRWETQRGCPYRCSFCQHREAGARLTRRALWDARVHAEIDRFCDVGVESIAVLDPIFNVGSRARDILAHFAERRFRGRLALQCRAELLDDAFLDTAAELDVCLELGLQTIHEAEGMAIDRRNDVRKVDRALDAIRSRGIDHEVTLIFGLPLQTLASFEETVRFCIERRVPVIKAFPLMLLRGTALDLRRDEWKLEESDDPMPVVVASSTFGRADFDAMARISEALRRTEGAHPTRMAELLELSAKLEPELDRFRPSVREQSVWA